MWSEDNFQYAIENTEVILAPGRQDRDFRPHQFPLLSHQRADGSGERSAGARRPDPRRAAADPDAGSLRAPPARRLRRKGARYVEQLRERAQQFAVLRYGFQFRKTDVMEKTVRASMASVIEQTKAQVAAGGRTAQRRDPGRGRRLGSLPAQVHDRPDRTLQRRECGRFSPARIDVTNARTARLSTVTRASFRPVACSAPRFSFW